MRMIKFSLIMGENSIDTPEGHIYELKHMAFQRGDLMGWFVDDEISEDDVFGKVKAHQTELYVAVTGETVPNTYFTHRATAMNDQHTFVVHAFQ